MNTPDNSTCPTCGCPIPSDAPRSLCPKCVLEGAAAAAASTTAIRGKTVSLPTVEEIAPHFPELEILDLLGVGGMGVVYKVRQPKLDRLVALKILSHDLSSDPAFIERFKREARVLARLSHPNIVGIFDFGTAGPYCYFLMEYVDGVNLRQAMQAGRFTPTESLAMVEEICSALKFAHEEGILHRDIKPENVLLDSKGRVKIADFGIAKLVGEGERVDVTLTMQGSILGSPHYMAPEQIETPSDVDQRADIYSLGVVFYELLTGELPIGRFALPSQKGAMDARIDEIVLRTLEKERQARFQTADEMQTRVKTVASSPAPSVPASTSTAPADERSTARFSLASTILTGISLPMAFVMAYLFATVTPVRGESMVSTVVSSIGGGWALFNLISLLGTALPGFILGSRALSDIHSSGGTKGGLGSALFGVTTWPILFLFLIALFSGPGAGLSWGSNMLLPIAALTTLITGMILFWALRRWTLGITRKDGTPLRLGFGRALAIILVLVVGGPILVSQTLKGFVSPRGSLTSRLDPFAYKSRKAITYFDEGNIAWHRGEAELAFPVRVHSAIRAEFYLVLKNGAGQPKEYSQIGVWQGTGEQSIETGMIKIGTVGPKGDAPETEGGFAAHLNLTPESGEIVGVPDFGEWQLNVLQHQILPYTTIGRYATRVGECIKVSDDQITTITGILELEVRVTQL